MNKKEELIQNNNIKGNRDESNEKIYQELKENDTKEKSIFSEFKNSSLKDTTYDSQLFFPQKESASPESKEPKHAIQFDFNNKIDNSKKLYSNNINSENSLKSFEEKILLENMESLMINTIEDKNKKDSRKEESKVNHKKYNYDIYKNNHLFHEKYNNILMPLFLGINKLNNIQNSLTKEHILFCFSDQNMTKILQSMINGNCPKDNIDSIIKELKGTYSSIIKNKNGNYFCCDLFKVCEQKHRIEILKELSETLSSDCIEKFATYPIQILIEYASSEEEYNLILNSFCDYNNLLVASLDANGSYVIQKIIKKIPEKYRIKFNLLFISILNFIITKKFGIINAKAFFDYTRNEDILNYVINIIKVNFIEIATNQFGNYFIQHLIEKWGNTKEGAIIKDEIINNFGVLSENKYSSFICDLFLKLANNNEKKQLMVILNLNLINNNSNNNKLMMMKIIKSLNQSIEDKNDNHINNINNLNNNSQFLNSQNNFTINRNSSNLINQNQLALNKINRNNFNNCNNNMFYKKKKSNNKKDK